MANATYDQREALQATLPDLAAATVTALGDGWAADSPHGHNMRLTGPDGAELWLNAPYGVPPGQITVSGSYPHGGQYRAHHKTINVTAARGAAVIAAEIRRRLLPVYLPELVKAQAGVAAQKADDLHRAEVIGQLRDVFPTREYNDGRFSYNTDGVYVRVEVRSAGSVQVEVHGDVDSILPALRVLLNT